jgi:hypothetical protein
MATQPFGIEVDCSSPWGEDDYHAQLFDQGETAHQQVSFAPSWVANPTLTEAATHELEPDERVWSREYAAVPGATVSQALDGEDVKAAFEPLNNLPAVGLCHCAIDASSLRGDGFCWLIAGESPIGLLIANVKGIEGEQLRRHSMASIVEAIAADCGSYGAKHVFGDQREAASLESLFCQQSLGFTSFAWSEPSKDEAFQLLRRLLRERKLHIEDHATLKKEMLAIKAHLLPSGRTKYATNGLDFVSALVTLIHAILAGDVLVESTHRMSLAEMMNLNHFEPESRWAGYPEKGFG